LIYVYKKPVIDEEVVEVPIDRDEEVIQGMGSEVPKGGSGMREMKQMQLM
jgi:hypothetical protein